MVVFALSLSSEIEKYGAYAGFAAIPGLAVMALLYFAQAREVRRLREWAGRAPERAQEVQERVSTQAAQRPAAAPAAPAPAPERRVVAQPMAAGTPAARVAQGSAAAKPAASPGATPAGQPGAAPASPGQGATPGTPAPVPAGQAGAAPTAPASSPGQAGAAPAVPASPGQGATPGTPAPGQAGSAPATSPRAPGSAPASPTPAPATARAGTVAPAAPDTGEDRTAAPAPSTAAASARPPVAERTEVRRAGAAPVRRQPTSPPRAPSGRRAAGAEGGRRRPLAIGIAVLAGLLVVILLATQVFGGSDKPASKPNTVGAPAPAAPASPTGRQPTVQRGDVTVAVLNGTTVPGLAAQVGDQVQGAGFARGQVTNAADQQVSETTVQYAPQFKAAANEVAGILKIPRTRVKPLDANTQAIAGPDAEVVVTVGADRTQ
ncbi:MAG: hypothetical protein QOE65_2426 [Solirubrobacteraceae bacterium]|nr:hypothetical protein [Solirubrobacteraceae bacterium]